VIRLKCCYLGNARCEERKLLGNLILKADQEKYIYLLWGLNKSFGNLITLFFNFSILILDVSTSIGNLRNKKSVFFFKLFFLIVSNKYY
jgi:hypothetical protein